MKYTLFGESHGSHIGIVLENVPAGLALDMQEIQKDMQRRSAKALASISTARHEKDEVNIISGVFNGYTTGMPICALIENTSARSKDYDDTRFYARPSHADYAAHMRYNGFNDFRGGGHFSGRLTASHVFAGAVAKQELAKHNIYFYARVREIYGIADRELDKALLNQEDISALKNIALQNFPTLSKEQGEKMQEAILEARKDLDALGGIIECFVLGLDAGYGSPSYNENLEGILANAMFSIPAVKGIEFGTGFELARMKSSEANDAFYADENKKVYSKTNHNGGINGGISNGMAINFSVVIKPTPSIYKKQNTIDMRDNSEVELEIKGRHDPCVVPRTVVVVEAAAALAISTLFEKKHG